ncbi:MAG TPA: hypothetical protein PLF38_06755 [Xylanibacter oryzae]|nr:hypothetical protein [Xylanibacter oryzae]
MKQNKQYDDEELYQQFMDELQEGAEEYDRLIAHRKTPRLRKLWPWIAAACVAGLIMVSLRPPITEQSAPQIAKVVQAKETHKPNQVSKKTITSENKKTKHAAHALQASKVSISETKENENADVQKDEHFEILLPSEEAKAYYASVDNAEKRTYQNPGDADDYIARLADYYGIEKVILNNQSSKDSCQVESIYVFPDKKEVDLFGKLLQMAFWYKNDTPGYFLNFTNRQFLFQLKDVRKDLNYLWLAEREGGSILLYLTRAPIGSKLTSNSYKEYREKWVQQNNRTIHKL